MPIPRNTSRTTRSSVAAALALAAAVLLAGCGGDATAGGTGTKLALDAALPTTVPAGAKIVVGDPTTQKALELSGQLDKVSGFVQFANLSGGPQTTEAFRANALDVGSVAEIPSIHATWTGLHVKIVASKFRQDPINHPIYELGVAPGVEVKTLADLRGKKIAYSPGQAQGALDPQGAEEGRTDQGRRQAGRAAQHRRRLPERAGGQAGRRRADRRCLDQALPEQVRQGRRHHHPARHPRRRRPPLRADLLAGGRRQGRRDQGVRRRLGCRPGVDRQAPEGMDRGLLREGPGPDRRGRSVARRQRRASPTSAPTGATRSSGTRRPSTCWRRRPATR